MSNLTRFPHLGLTEWPFSVVPTPRGTLFMAARAELKQEIADLLRRLSRRPQSSLHLMWAWFGAGKTHALQFLSHVAESDFRNVQAVYTEFPKSAQGFTDLYGQVASAWLLDSFAEAYLETVTGGKATETLKRVGLGQDLKAALDAMVASRKPEAIAASRWLSGEQLPESVLQPLGIYRAIETPEDCGRILASLVSLYGVSQEGRGSGPGRTILILDEFQRISTCSAAIQQEITTSLHSLLNMCPSFLTIILSFSGRPESRLPVWLSAELADRLGIEPVLVLPPLGMDEAKLFVADVLREYRPPSFRGNTFSPFQEKTVEQIIEIIDHESEVKPRTLMQFFGAVLEEADPLIERGGLRTISPDFARKVLAGRSFATTEELEELVHSLQRSRSRIVMAQEAVRKEIAGHLHGRVQGRLLALRLQMDELAREENLPQNAGEKLKAVADEMDHVIQRDIAMLSRRLYPAIVRRGLVPALQSLVDEFESSLDLTLEVPASLVQREHATPAMFDERTCLAAYRIAEEALTNVGKHASSAHVTVGIEFDGDCLTLRVRDNGSGFDPKHGGASLGLVEMQDYAEAAGGRCEVKSRPGAGTVVEARLPCLVPLAATL